jgi:hypothetical protein
VDERIASLYTADRAATLSNRPLHLTAPGRSRAPLARGAIVDSCVPQVSGNPLAGQIERHVDMSERSRWPWYGLAFGCVLFVFAFGSAGAGHGSYLPLTIFAAPLSLIPFIGLFSAPVWWAAVGWLLKQQRTWVAALTMMLHGGAVGLILWLGTPGEPGNEQWRYFRATEQIMPLWLWSGIVIYGMGVATTWLVIARSGAIASRAMIRRLAG